MFKLREHNHVASTLCIKDWSVLNIEGPWRVLSPSRPNIIWVKDWVENMCSEEKHRKREKWCSDV